MLFRHMLVPIYIYDQIFNGCPIVDIGDAKDDGCRLMILIAPHLIILAIGLPPS